jgi:hypothetical protein
MGDEEREQFADLERDFEGGGRSKTNGRRP